MALRAFCEREHWTTFGEVFDTVYRLHVGGKGYQRISNEVMALGINTSKSSIARLLKGKGTCRG